MAKKAINKKEDLPMEEMLWKACDALRGSIEPSEYKHVVLSLIFLKYAGFHFEKRRQEIIDAGQEAFVANGALSADGTEGAIRRKMIERGLVEAIVILPRNLFYSTDISVTMWILNANKKARVVKRNGEEIHYRDREKEILFIDMRQMGEPFEKKYVRFSDEDIKKVADTYHNWQREGHTDIYANVPEFCYSASFDEVKERGFSLVPSKYIEFVNRDATVDYETRMKELQTELADILREEVESRNAVLNVFKSLGYEIDI